jgi:hypothetical protein
VGLAVVVAGCRATSSRSEPGDHPATASGSSPPASAAPLAEGRIDNPKLIVRLTGMARTAPDVLTLSFAVSNADPAVTVSLGSNFATAAIDIDSMADTYLFDEAHRKKYFVMRDDQGRAVCSQDVGTIPAGQEREVWCRFAGPPDSVARISIGVPRLPMFRAVAISAPAEGKGRR